MQAVFLRQPMGIDPAVGHQARAIGCGAVGGRPDQHRMQLQVVAFKQGRQRLQCQVAVGVVDLVEIEQLVRQTFCDAPLLRACP